MINFSEKLDSEHRRRVNAAEGRESGAETAKEDKEKEELKKAAARERAERTSREIQSTRKRMQNIMANMQQVIKAVQAIRQQLDLTEPDENIPSVARDRRTLESLQKKLNSLSGQLNNLRAALLQEELGEAFVPLMRRLMLQVTDSFWLEHLDSMEYLRRSVSLRAYGQRDPLIEYRREGLGMFNAMQAAIRIQVAEALPHIMPADDSRIRAEEEKVRRQILAASEAGAETSNEPVVHEHTYGRNDEVTIQRGDETQVLKFKKAEPLLAEGWEIRKG